jgi:hypothetical protein
VVYEIQRATKEQEGIKSKRYALAIYPSIKSLALVF